MTEKQSFILTFKEDISLIEHNQQFFLQSSSGATKIPLKNTTQGIQAVLRTLSAKGATEEQLIEIIEQHDKEVGLPILFYLLEIFTQAGLICHTLVWKNIPLATIIPLSSNYQFVINEPTPNQAYVLSRFAYLHQENQYWVLDSPLSHSQMMLHHWRATALLHILAQPKTLTELSAEFPNLSPTTLSLFLSCLLYHQVLNQVNQDGKIIEAPNLVQWTFHDLLFHSRSREGRHDNLYGVSHHFEGKIPPLPVVKPPMSDTVIPLYQPNIQALNEHDLPLTCVIEERCSLREHGTPAITITQLGEFLFRTARVKQIIETEERTHELSNRPYPSGGACYELELYVLANACQGLQSGFYHYCPKEHSLEKLIGQKEQLEQAYFGTTQQNKPQILLILTARFQRVTWRYNSMAYALILKNVGVLFQTMYLVATAMKLAPCALGGGNSDFFATAVGTDYYTETSVGEFILGSRINTFAKKPYEKS